MSGYILARLGAQLVAGLGVTKIVSGIVKNNVPIVTTAEKVMVNAGTFVLGSMLVEQSSNHIERMAKELKSGIKFKVERDSTEDVVE